MLGLVVCDGDFQPAIGFDAAMWGVLPTLVNLRTLKISYPADLAPGLAAWLIPRSVRALSLDLDYVSFRTNIRDPVLFLDVRLIIFSYLVLLTAHHDHLAISPWYSTRSTIHRPDAISCAECGDHC